MIRYGALKIISTLLSIVGWLVLVLGILASLILLAGFVADPQTLEDFLAQQGEEQVCLCWKVGEPRVEFWHGLQGGYAGRKPIRNEFA